MTRQIFTASEVWTPSGLVENAAVEVDEAFVIRDIRPRQKGDPSPLNGVIIPGTVNAHLHVELSGFHQQVPGGEGLVPWVRQLLSVRRETNVDERDPQYLSDSIGMLKSYGTAAVCDISNSGDSAPLFANQGISGIVQHEQIGLQAADMKARIAQVELGHTVFETPSATIVSRAAPHALYSTRLELVDATVGQTDLVPSSIHLAEDTAELEFLGTGEGPFLGFCEQLNLDLTGWSPPGMSPMEVLAQRGLLGPQLLLVHGVHLQPQDWETLGDTGAYLCLCPRSNMHIGGVLPDVVGLIEAGVSLCLGTDSMASSPDLDVLAEIPVLASAFPEIDPGIWLNMATMGGADALGLTAYGRIEKDKAPGLLFLRGRHSPEDIAHSVPKMREWLCPPGARPFSSGVIG